jgi:DNA-binding LacI/PurR family transcriptional regulator
VVETRIRRGDYAIRELPTEQELAEEIGISRMTARRALLHLMEKGILLRKPHGRLAINHAQVDEAKALSVACLSPAYRSPYFDVWRRAVERAGEKFGASVRLVDYVHWQDAVIPQTLLGFDGVFLVPSSAPIPEAMLTRFGQAGNLVVLEGDMTDRGVPSADMLPAVFIDRLGDHLYQLGHRNIDCINTQPRDRVVTQRLERWAFWKQLHRVDGQVIDAPVAPYQHPTPQAYTVMARLLKAGEFHATAVLCITDDVTTGVIRALQEYGLQVGKDVSVCAMEGAGMARYQWPSRTVLEPQDPLRFVEVCMEWMAKKSVPWTGPLLIQPSDVPLFVGESTGPCSQWETGR